MPVRAPVTKNTLEKQVQGEEQRAEGRSVKSAQIWSCCVISVLSVLSGRLRPDQVLDPKETQTKARPISLVLIMNHLVTFLVVAREIEAY